MLALGVLGVLVVVGFCIRLLYDDVMTGADPWDGTPPASSQKIFGLFGATFLILSLYIAFSVYSCWVHGKEDQRVLRSHRRSPKKVKDMSARQKARRRQGEDALWRKEHMFCRYNALKVIGVVSTLVAVLVVYPYAKKTRDMSVFVLLSVLMLPVFSVVGVAFVMTPRVMFRSNAGF